MTFIGENMLKLILPLIGFAFIQNTYAWTYNCNEIVSSHPNARINIVKANIVADISLDGISLDGTYTAAGDDYELMLDRFYHGEKIDKNGSNYYMEKVMRSNPFVCGAPGYPCLEKESVEFDGTKNQLRYTETFRMKYLSSTENIQFDFVLQCKKQ